MTGRGREGGTSKQGQETGDEVSTGRDRGTEWVRDDDRGRD